MFDTRTRIVCKRDGRIVPFSEKRLYESVVKAFRVAGRSNLSLALDVAKSAMEILSERFAGKVPVTSEIEVILLDSLVSAGLDDVAGAYRANAERTAKARRKILVRNDPDSPFDFKPINGKPAFCRWSKGSFAVSLAAIADLPIADAMNAAGEVERKIIAAELSPLTATMLLELARMELGKTRMPNKLTGLPKEISSLHNKQGKAPIPVEGFDDSRPSLIRINLRDVSSGGIDLSKWLPKAKPFTFGDAMLRACAFCAVICGRLSVRLEANGLEALQEFEADDPNGPEVAGFFFTLASVLPVPRMNAVSFSLNTDACDSSFAAWAAKDWWGTEPRFLPRFELGAGNAGTLLNSLREWFAGSGRENSNRRLTVTVGNSSRNPVECCRMAVSLPGIFLSPDSEREKMLSQIADDAAAVIRNLCSAKRDGEAMTELRGAGVIPAALSRKHCAVIEVAGIEELIRFRVGDEVFGERGCSIAVECLSELRNRLNVAAKERNIEIRLAHNCSPKAASLLAYADCERLPQVRAVLSRERYSSELSFSLDDREGVSLQGIADVARFFDDPLELHIPYGDYTGCAKAIESLFEQFGLHSICINTGRRLES